MESLSSSDIEKVISNLLSQRVNPEFEKIYLLLQSHSETIKTLQDKLEGKNVV
jgi:hypothetical protein